MAGEGPKGKYLSWLGFSYTDYIAAPFTEYSGNDELILLSFFPRLGSKSQFS